MSGPSRGEVWRVDLNPTRGHEQAGTHPALVVSAEAFNRGPAGLVVALPITTADRRIPSHIGLLSPEGGVRVPCFVKCEDVRSLSTERLIDRWGRVSEESLRRVVDVLRILLDL